MEVFLYNSTVCRLCGEENDNGTFLYSTEENNQNIGELVNAFLPIRVFDDGQLPRTICPGCTIQLEATVEFITLIVNGQKVIRALHQREIQYKKSVLSTNENETEFPPENVAQEIDIENGAYPPEHKISLQVAGLERPKRKRGRPPKKVKTPEELALEAAVKESQDKFNEEKQDEEPTGKRRRKAPTRFQEVVQGKELEKIFIEEGMTDGEDSEPDVKPNIVSLPADNTPKVPEIIGHTDSGELVVVVKGKGRGRPKGRLHQKSQKCAICDKEFVCSGRYMSHIAQHGPVVYQCLQCSDKFDTRIDFTAHQDLTGHKGKTVLPKDKKEEVLKADPLTMEEATPADETKETLAKSLPDLSTEVVEQKVQFKIEIESKIDVKKDTEAKEEKSIEEEEENASAGRKKLKCPQCDKVFSSRQSRFVHVRAIHRGERAFSCKICGATFQYPRALTLHSLKHKGSHSKGFACDLCGKVLNHPSSVTYHKEAEHAGHKFVCNKCGKCFKHKQLLQRHQLVHTQNRPFQCKVCNAAFKTKANLFNHQLLHSGVKRHSCDVCKQRFAHKTSLTLHMRWHNGQKPYVCKDCGKAFSQKGNLSEHARIHTGEKPFACVHCPRRFTTSSQHRLHIKRHIVDAEDQTKEALRLARTSAAERELIASIAPPATIDTPTRIPRPKPLTPIVATTAPIVVTSDLQCTYCGRLCPSRWALAKHVRRHTGERPFHCPLCPRAFADASNLNKHKKHIHKQVSLLAKQRELTRPPPVESRAEFIVESEMDNSDERVIYVTYDVEDGQSPSYTLVEPEQEVVEEISSDQYSRVFVQPKLSLPDPAPSEDHMCVTDEQGNPLHFTMQDGTQLAITSLDGQSLQVITQDGQTIPVEINGFSPEPMQQISEPPTIVHQLVQKSEDEDPNSPITHYYTIV